MASSTLSWIDILYLLYIYMSWNVTWWILTFVLPWYIYIVTFQLGTNKFSLNAPRRQKSGWWNSQHQAQHAKLHSALLLVMKYKSKTLITLDCKQRGTSASTVQSWDPNLNKAKNMSDSNSNSKPCSQSHTNTHTQEKEGRKRLVYHFINVSTVKG